MKIEVTIKYGVASRITNTVYVDPSVDRVHEFIRKVIALMDELKSK